MKHLKHEILLATGIVGITLTGNAAMAQNSSETELDDIVVTARRQTESLMRVPVAVTALGRNELEQAHVTDLTRIVQITPGVKVSSTVYGTSFVIRGIGSAPVNPGIEQTVLLNLDGINAGRGRLGSLSIFDVQQVEILKGPQALFFGKNSPGGVFSVTTAGPGQQLEGYAHAGYEFVARERFAEAAIGGPLTETLGVRIALRATKMDGWLRNRAVATTNPFQPGFDFPAPTSSRLPARRNYVGRITTVWKPSDRVDFTLKVFGSDYRDNATTAEHQAVCATARPVTWGVTDATGDCKLNRNVSFTPVPPGIAVTIPRSDTHPYDDFRAGLVSLTSNVKLDNMTLTSVTGFYNMRDRNFGGVQEAASQGFIFASNLERTTYWTQELRIVSQFDSAFNFTAGGYFEHGDRKNFNAVQIAPVGLDPASGKYHSSESAAHIRNTTYSLFGQLRWQIVPDLELAGGARWTREKKRISVLNQFVHPALVAVFAPQGAVLRVGKTEHNVSPEATLTWHPTSSSTLYGAFKTGYKSGGFDTPPVFIASLNNAASVTFDREKARGGEIGYKGSFLDRSLQLQATVFRYTYKGLQLTSFDATTISYRTNNAAAARTQGAELQVDWRATPDLRLHGDINYTRARFTRFTTAPCFTGQTAAQGCVTVGGQATQSLTGTPPERAPDWTANLGFNYDIPISEAFTLGLNGDAAYTSSYHTSETHAPLSKQPGFWLLGAGVRLTATQGWELAFIGRNLTNKYYRQLLTDRPGGNPGELIGLVPRPRELLLQASYRF